MTFRRLDKRVQIQHEGEQRVYASNGYVENTTEEKKMAKKKRKNGARLEQIHALRSTEQLFLQMI